MLSLSHRQANAISRQTHRYSTVKPIPLTVVRFKPSVATVEAPVSHAAPKAADNSITLNFNGKQERLRLINGKIQLNAVKDAFNLKSVQLDGQLEPVDQLGFTVAEYEPGQTILVSGSPVAEMEKLQAEIAGLRAELQSLKDIRDDLRNVASLSHSFSSMTESYDDIRRLLDPSANVEDFTIIKRLLAEIVMGSRDSPDFTKTSQDGYTFDTFWEGRMLAKDIISKNTEARRPHERKHRHHDHMDAEEVMSSFHAT
jgi:hypothetical protein